MSTHTVQKHFKAASVAGADPWGGHRGHVLPPQTHYKFFFQARRWIAVQLYLPYRVLFSLRILSFTVSLYNNSPFPLTFSDVEHDASFVVFSAELYALYASVKCRYTTPSTLQGENTRQCCSAVTGIMHKIYKNMTFLDERTQKFSVEWAQFRGGQFAPKHLRQWWLKRPSQQRQLSTPRFFHFQP